MTDGDGLTYRVLLRSGGFSDTVCAKQVCILKTPQRGKVNKPRLTYSPGVSPDTVSSSICMPKIIAIVTLLGRDTTLECFHSSHLPVGIWNQIQAPVTSIFKMKSLMNCWSFD